jgi:hypothetical protein
MLKGRAAWNIVTSLSLPGLGLRGAQPE